MIDAPRENCPLLSEDISDDDLYQRSLNYRGRARSRGAAAVITRWPDHWSSFKHFWTILGLFALIVMIVYNAVILFSIFPASYPKVKERSMDQYKNVRINQKLPEVFMHIFTHNNKENIDSYLPYLDTLAQDFTEYRYTIFMVLNDTTDKNMQTSVERYNELALSNIMSKKEFITEAKVRNQNINIKKMSLSNYMDHSPLRKCWRKIPPHFIPFLVRSISVWEHGGIAFNPAIITPASPNRTYIRILRIILKKHFQAEQLYQTKYEQQQPFKNVPKTILNNSKKEVHNIRDIIDAIENEIESSDLLQSTLSEVETHNEENVVRRRKLMEFSPYIVDKYSKNKTLNDTFKYSNLGFDIKNKTLSELETMRTKIKHFLHLDRTTQNKTIENKTKNNYDIILPSFFDLFKLNISPDSVSNSNKNANKSKIPFDIESSVSINAEERLLNELNSLVAIDSDAFIDKSNIQKYENIKNTKEKLNNLDKRDNVEQLFVDISGNILATGTACHAFIGSIFTNVAHAQERNLTDYLLSQLSSFCKGSLNPCLVPGFHVIIL